MNYMLNRLDNLKLKDKTYDIISENIKREINIDGKILGVNGKFLVSGRDAMLIVKKSRLQQKIGELNYRALMRKPMMVFFMASSTEDFTKSKEELENKYSMWTINLSNIAQAFSIGCWFIKDSCVSSTNMYYCNMFNGYYSQNKRDMAVTLSTGEINEITLNEFEMKEAIDRMYQVLYLLIDGTKVGKVEKKVNAGTNVFEIDKAISTEGKSFGRALILLQEARRTGFLSAKIDKYCSMLECLYAINKNHKKNISNITAAYIGKDNNEREVIRSNMKEAYSIRSDGSHGDTLKYLEKNDEVSLKRLSKDLDDYVRRVFRKIINKPELNYDKSLGNKAETRLYFMNKAKDIYPNDY